MNKVNLKDSIFIEGFSYEEICAFSKEDWRNIVEDVRIDHVIYSGKTSEIPEELVKKLLKECDLGYVVHYPDFKKNLKATKIYHTVNTAKESIKSACSEEYCLIYKEK
jgi:hypothetical protein